MSLPIPKGSFEQHMIFLGKTGAGKSSAVRDVVEELLGTGRRVVIITPKSDWWGIKLAADGKHAGYPLVVFGGDHQDMPLHHLSGKHMAELLATGNRSAVLQMREFMPAEREQFWGDFAANLFRLLEGKMYLVIDEVHNFAPKGKVEGRAATMLHWSNKLASEARGLGITLIAASQRPQKVHNDFLTSCETLIAMRVTTKWDREAIADWIDGCGDREQGKEVLNSLAQMKRGDAWVWSPEIEFGPKQIHFPMFQTYDSFKPQEPKALKSLSGWAEVNLDDVRQKLAHVVKEAEANDPSKLRARVSQLERELRQRSSGSNQAAKKEVDDRAIDRAVKSAKAETAREFEARIRKLRSIASQLFSATQFVARQAGEAASKAIPGLKEFDLDYSNLTEDLKKVPAAAIQKPKEDREKTHTLAKPRPIAVPRAGSNGDAHLTEGERKILIAIAQSGEADRTQISIMSGYKRSTRDRYLQYLVQKGMVDARGDSIRPTQEGIDALGSDYEPLPTGSALADYWLRELPQGEKAILEFLIGRGNEPVDRDDISESVGFKRSTRDRYLQYLVARKIVEPVRGGQVKASDALFD